MPDNNPDSNIERKTPNDADALDGALKQRLSDEALNLRAKDELTPVLKLNSSLSSLSKNDLVQETEAKSILGVAGKQTVANFAGTLGAGISGTVAWSLMDKALGNTRYGLAAKLAGSFIAGGGTRFAVKGGTEMLLLDPKDRTTGLSDFAWGGVDALAAVGALKAEEAFSKSWRINLGKSSGLHLSQETMLEQGSKLIAGNLNQRITHNALRGVVGGSTGALLWSTPHEIASNFKQLNSLEGWKKTSDNIAMNTLFGAAFGGVIMGGGTALWNVRELAGATKASLLGKQGRYELDIYHFNDGHSSVLGERSTLPQLAGKAEQLREASKKSGVSSLVLDMGDAHAGNAAAIVSNTGDLEQRLIHQSLKVDASIPGNHSADTGIASGKDVKQWINNMRSLNHDLQAAGREVPGLAANVQSVLDPKFIGQQGIYKPYKVFVDPKNGEKVGLVGLVTDQLQGATPKLIDIELALGVRKFGTMNLAELAEKAATDPASKALLEKLSGDAILKQVIENTPATKVSELVEQLLQTKYLKGLTPEAQQSFRTWFTLAGEHPQATLAELAGQNASNKNLALLASIHPEKRIADLNQIMVSDPLKALQDSVKALEADGVKKVIVMSHMGKSADLQLAKDGPRVAAIFGGHSHNLEPTPLFVKNAATGSDVLVGQAGNAYGWLGEAKLVFNKDGSINRFLSSGKVHVIDESVAPLKDAQDRVLKYMNETDAGKRLLEQVGVRHPVRVQTEIPLDKIRGETGTQTPLANLLAKSFKEGGDQLLANANALRVAQGMKPLSSSEIDAVLIQSGGIRAGLPAGQLDELTLQTMFMNQPTLVEMNGTQIQKALSYGMHDFPVAAKPEGIVANTKSAIEPFLKGSSPLAELDASGKNIIAGELRFTVDRTRPSYDRVQNLEIFDRALAKYVPIDPNKNYTVMTVSHLLKRFGGTPMMPASQMRNISTESLGPEFWVLGKPMSIDEVRSTLQASDLPTESSRHMLLSFLSKNSTNGQFSLPQSLYASPMKDISPGMWMPKVKPSWTIGTLGAVSAKDAWNK